MLSQEVMGRIEQLATRVAEEAGCILYDLDFVGTGSGRTLRVFIDRKEGLVGIEDCTNVSRGLNSVLDVEEDFIPGGAYQLEVSTPGVERTLRKPWHFTSVIGKKIQVRLSRPLQTLGVEDKGLQPAKQFSQEIASTTEKGVVFSFAGQEVEIPFDVIEKAKVIFEFTNPKANKKR